MVCRAQLGRLEEQRAAFEQAGASLAAICVDPVDRSKAVVEAGRLGFPILSDASGEVARAWGVWHESKKIALPAVFVVGADQRVAWRMVSEVVTTRPAEEELLRVVRGLPPAAAPAPAAPAPVVTPPAR